jgi:uncharacterized protein YuzE
MQLEFDLDIGALYIRLGGQPVARTREAGRNAHVDLAEDGTLVGIEVISFAHPWPLDDILSQYRVPDAELRQICGYFGPQQMIVVPAGPPAEPPQMATAPAELPVERTPVLTTV